MRNQLSLHNSTLLKLAVSACLLLVFSLSGIAQSAGNEQVKRLQRSIFVFNFAQQVGGWPNFQSLENFTIGVLGNDRSILDLQALALKRTIQNKAVKIVRFNSVKEIKGVQLVYVNQKFNFDIDYILSKIKQQKILLVTEDYNYKSSMINMIGVGNSFEYEINADLMRQEGFTSLPSLQSYAVSSSQKWQDLYKTAEKSLISVKELEAKREKLLKERAERISNQEALITKQKEAIDTTLKSISEKNNWIKQLGNESELQKKKYEEKLLIEKELEDKIQWQIAIAKAQKTQIDKRNSEIEKQTALLNLKSEEIQAKNDVLEEKNAVIDATKKANIFLIIIVILSIVSMLLVYRSYLVKKRLSAALDEKNNAILQQSRLLEAKNKKLEQFNYIATHDLKVPISNLEGYYSFLVEDLKTDNKELLDTVKWIGKSIEQSKLMISDLVQIIESETRQEDSELIYFEVITDEILQSLNKEIIANKAEVQLNFDRCSRINYAKVELKSILQNLISNAIKYKSPDRTLKIDIQTSFKEEFVLLSVSDNGLGINLEKHSKDLFAPFKQIHTSEGGSGIGLYMIKDVIESAGGKIEVKSAVNEGTEFIVYLKPR